MELNVKYKNVEVLSEYKFFTFYIYYILFEFKVFKNPVHKNALKFYLLKDRIYL